MAEVVPFERLWPELGCDTEEAAALAREALEIAGLTRPGKTGMSAKKLDDAQDAVDELIFRVCHQAACRKLAPVRAEGREVVTVSPACCQVCGGSSNRLAAQRLARALDRAGVRRLLVVGGTPVLHRELETLIGESPVGKQLKLRCVDGAQGRHTLKQAKQNLAWADFAVVWGATPLPHKVSNLYTARPDRRRDETKVISFAKRGISSLCDEIIRGVR